MKLAVPPLLHVFFRAPGARPLATAACLFVAGVFDVIGMSIVIPFVASVTRGGSGGATRLGALGAAVLDRLHVPHNMGVILLCITAALCLKSLMGYAAMTFVSSSVAQVGLNLRRKLLDAMMKADLRFFTVQHPGRIANMLVHEVANAANAYNQAALSVAELLKLAGILTIACLISGWLLVAALLTAVLSTYVLSLFVRLRTLAKLGQYEVSDQLLRRAQDTFAGIKALKGMGRTAASRRLIEGGMSRLRQEVLRDQATRHTINAAQDILMALALCGGIYACIAWLGIGTAELLVLATLFLFMTNALRLLQALQQNFRETLPAFIACEEILAAAQSHAEPDAGRKPAGLHSAIIFDQVTFAYGERTILDSASFEIEAGSITVLEGESGVGKTTTIDLIIGFHAPQAGNVLVDGVPLREISASDWRSAIGYVPQELLLVEGSILDNITLGDERIGRDAALDAIELAGLGDFVRTLPEGLDSEVGVVGSKLSGGQRQRISLARALVCKPRLLILDEVTSALDFETEQQICASLARLAPPTTIIAITHRPAWSAIASAILRFDERGVRTSRPEPPANMPEGPMTCSGQ